MIQVDGVRRRIVSRLSFRVSLANDLMYRAGYHSCSAATTISGDDVEGGAKIFIFSMTYRSDNEQFIFYLLNHVYEPSDDRSFGLSFA